MAAERYQHTETERRIRAALGTMPGGACEALNAPARGVGFNADRNPCRITLESVAVYLEALVEHYGEWSQRVQVDQQALTALRGDVAAVRRLFGIGDEP